MKKIIEQLIVNPLSRFVGALLVSRRIKETLGELIVDVLRNDRVRDAALEFGRFYSEASLQNLDYRQKVRTLSTTVNYVETHLQNARPLSSQFEIYDFVISNLEVDDGLFCEFGVYKGKSINYIADRIKQEIHGFDSFQGLPEFWRAGFDQGEFKLNPAEIPEVRPNVKLYIGWFDDTLKEFVINHQAPISLLHVDCDLYSSTKTIFGFLGKQLVQGSIIIFDEYFNYPGWQNHEFKAFQEYVKEHNISYEYLCYNKYHEQVAVKIV